MVWLKRGYGTVRTLGIKFHADFREYVSIKGTMRLEEISDPMARSMDD
jgi:hypothetical protein